MTGRFSPLAIMLVAAVLLAGCTLAESLALVGSGNIVTPDETVTGFDRLDISHAFRADVSQGDTFSVVIRIDDNLVQYLNVSKRGSTLEIGLDPLRSFTITRATMEADVTMPELAGLDLSGATRADIRGFSSTQDLSADVSEASTLRGDIEAGDARFEVSGASTVDLRGSAVDVRVDASGASTVDLADFPVDDADVEASGASTVTVNLSGTLDADASGASRVLYLGNPSLGRIDTSGASSITRR